MIKRHQRSLSFVLSFSLFLTAFTGFSVQSAQASPQPTSARSAPPTSDELGLTGDPNDENDLKENYSLRSVNSKTYRNKDGMNLVAVYDNAVHYLKDDAWKNIDNTLSEAPSVDGVAVLANKANNFSVKFAKTTKANFIGMLQKGNYSIKWSLKGAKESPVTKSVSDEVQPERAWDLTKVRSSVRYAQILPSTDLEYVVKGSEIKENLILNQPGLSESYTFLYQLSNLSARQDGNIIRFYDSRDSEKEVFALEAPFVFDAKDESTDAQFTLTDLGNGKVEVKVSVDPAWLSAPERVYPVVIDPPLRTSPVTSDILDAHVSRLAPDKNFSTTSYLSIGSSDTPGSLCRVYVKFNLPTMDPSDVVVDAKLNLFSRSYEGTGESEVQFHEVTSPWDDTSITWNNIPSHSSIISEYDRFSKSKEKLSFDVTGIVREWYNYGQNNGVMIKNADETGKFGTFYSGATSEPDTNLTRPYLTMAYVNNDGLEPYWDYQPASAGRAGTAHVNYFTGAMTKTQLVDGEALPIHHEFSDTLARNNFSRSSIIAPGQIDAVKVILA